MTIYKTVLRLKSPDLVAKLKAKAKRENRSLNSLIENILTENANPRLA